MKKTIFVLLGLTSCATPMCPNQYIANMYANGTLENYEDTGTGNACSENKNCPGCHVKHFDRVTLIVDEILIDDPSRVQGPRDIEGCVISVKDSLNLKNISEERYLPATNDYNCEIIYEKEKAYLKAMGFSE